MSISIDVVEDPARACAAMMLGPLSGGGHVVLTGGSTPRAAYGALVEVVRDVGVDVSGATLWFGDERCVPPHDERSNFRMAREALLEGLPELSQVHRMKGELGYTEGAEDYERQLRSAGSPEFDLLLLGLGPDGHTLSLFPGQDSVDERSRLVIGVPESGLEPFVPRISFTLAAVKLARQVLFLVSGASKADAVAAAFGPGAQADGAVPAALAAAAGREVKVLLDPAAAERL